MPQVFNPQTGQLEEIDALAFRLLQEQAGPAPQFTPGPAQQPSPVSTGPTAGLKTPTVDSVSNVGDEIPDVGGALPDLDKSTLSGHSAEDLYQGFLDAQNAGDKTNAAILRQRYEDELAYQKNQPQLEEPDEKEAEAINTIDALYSAYNEIPSSQKGRLEGKITSRVGELFPDVAAYQDVREAFAGSLKALVGETGRLTDQDITRILGAIPSATEPEAEANSKIATVRSIFEKRGIPVPDALKGTDKDFSAKSAIIDPILDNPLTRSVDNIFTAMVVFGQAGVASNVGAVNPQLGAKIAGADILGTQSRAAEIIENPDEELLQQVADSLVLGVAALGVKGGQFSKAKVSSLLRSQVFKNQMTGLLNKGTAQGLKGAALQSFMKEGIRFLIYSGVGALASKAFSGSKDIVFDE